MTNVTLHPKQSNAQLLPIIERSVAEPTPRALRLQVVTKSLLLRVYRLAVVVAIVVLLHRHEAWLRITGDAPIQLVEVRPFFPTAASLSVDDSDRLGLFVFDDQNQQVGYVLRTAPLANNITGYCGPTDTLVALDPEMKVVGVKVRKSDDTRQHVADVVADEYFMSTWNGKTWDEVAGVDPRAAGVEGVSGASLTSMCIANGIYYRFRHSLDANAQLPPMRINWNDAALIAVIVVACLFAFTNLRSRTWLRRAFQVLLIGYVGFWNGQLLAISLFNGWAISNVPWRIAPGLVLLAAAALIVPWGTRRPFYCGQICPHGAAQELVGRMVRRPWKVASGVDAGLRWLPGLLVAVALAVTMLKLPLDLAEVEPFDAYLIRTAGIATVVIAVIGLVAAAVIPMAYCKYGCPTGFVLSFVRSHGPADRFSRRDLVAAMLLLLVVALSWQYETVQSWITR